MCRRSECIRSTDGNPIPFRYAAMAGFNELLLDALFDNAATNLDQLTIEQADFVQKLVPRQRWVGTDAQLKATIEKLADTGYLKISRASISIEPKMHDVIVRHAQLVYAFMTGIDVEDLSKAPILNWLELNEAIFSSFFFGDRGRTWRDIRQKVNEKLVKRKGAGHGYTRNLLNENPSLWVALNVFALMGPMNRDVAPAH